MRWTQPTVTKKTFFTCGMQIHRIFCENFSFINIYIRELFWQIKLPLTQNASFECTTCKKMCKKPKKLYFFFKKALTDIKICDIIISFISVYVKFGVSLRSFLKKT